MEKDYGAKIGGGSSNKLPGGGSASKVKVGGKHEELLWPYHRKEAKGLQHAEGNSIMERKGV